MSECVQAAPPYAVVLNLALNCLQVVALAWIGAVYGHGASTRRKNGTP